MNISKRKNNLSQCIHAFEICVVAQKVFLEQYQLIAPQKRCFKIIDNCPTEKVITQPRIFNPLKLLFIDWPICYISTKNIKNIVNIFVLFW